MLLLGEKRATFTTFLRIFGMGALNMTLKYNNSVQFSAGSNRIVYLRSQAEKYFVGHCLGLRPRHNYYSEIPPHKPGF